MGNSCRRFPFPVLSMLSVIIPTNESERVLVRTLACLVPGSTAGLIREVILADANSTDETAQIGDIAGCRFLPMPGPLGPRLDVAANEARGTWLMFIPAGAVLETGWVADVQQFTERAPEGVAAAFKLAARPHGQDSLLREMIGLWQSRRATLSPGRGLLIGKAFFRSLGGYRDVPDTEADLLRRIGKKRLATLRTGITPPEILDSVK
jgi:glycosyltransferase involved in cell wall biosynthesis